MRGGRVTGTFPRLAVGALTALITGVGPCERARAEQSQASTEAQGPAPGGVCPGARAAAGGPLPGGHDDADFGAIPEACAGTDFALRLRGSALVASSSPDFFGAVVATSTLRWRHRLGSSSRLWLSAAADVLTYRYVVNGPVASQGVGFGPPTLGLHRALGEWPRTAATGYVRVLLPLDTARESGVRTGLELGLTVRRLLSPSGRAGAQGGVALLAPLVLIGGQTHPALQPVALAEGWYAVKPGFALFAGLSAKVELSPDATFLTLAPRLASRLHLGSGLSLALLLEAPVAGEDRTNFIAALTLAWAAAD